MAQAIEIDDEVYAHLKEVAEPFVDTPNTVLRRLLHLDNGARPQPPPDTLKPPASAPPLQGSGAAPSQTSNGRRPSRAKPQPKTNKKTRVPAGSILPEDAYEMPLLLSLAEAGGAAPSRAIVQAVGERLGSRLTDLDKEPLAGGAIRWENRVQFVRLKLIQRGLMTKEAPRGTWAISEEGKKYAEANS